MDVFEKVFRRNRMKTQHLISIACLSLLAYIVIRTTSILTPSAGNMKSFYINKYETHEDVSKKMNEMRVSRENYLKANPSGIDEFPELKKEYDGNEDHRTERELNEINDEEQAVREVQQDKNDRDSGNDIADLPTKSREHIQFIQEVPDTINTTTDSSTSTPSTTTLADILSFRSSVALFTKKPVEATIEKLEETPVNMDYVNNLEERFNTNENNPRIADYQLYPTEEISNETNVEKTFPVPNSPGALTNLTFSEKSSQNPEILVNQANNETTTNVGATAVDITTVPYSFTGRPEASEVDHSRGDEAVNINHVKDLQQREEQLGKVEKNNSVIEKMDQKGNDILENADTTREKREQLDSNDISQFII
ncbi:hypothetical protein NECAME_09439 [Necator americanus]|uniref:Uncharacterized protein n=1 Tax=Necator americanus TaxID=51031 RepID=W2TGC7_NECAM|nr:hypothetical protein NECAME_09439 [Necator americanus]ETN80072.1 hypothetical protein NECAME_09439 [Necator americanus]